MYTFFIFIRIYTFEKTKNGYNYTMSIIKCENISYVIKNQQADKIIDNVSFSVEKGDFVLVLGKSGSGKTTLLNIMVGLIKPSAGDIYIKDRKFSSLSDDEQTYWRRYFFGYIFQNYGLFDTLNVFDNIAVSLELKSLYSHRVKKYFGQDLRSSYFVNVDPLIIYNETPKNKCTNAMQLFKQYLNNEITTTDSKVIEYWNSLWNKLFNKQMNNYESKKSVFDSNWFFSNNNHFIIYPMDLCFDLFDNSQVAYFDTWVKWYIYEYYSFNHNFNQTTKISYPNSYEELIHLINCANWNNTNEEAKAARLNLLELICELDDENKEFKEYFKRCTKAKLDYGIIKKTMTNLKIDHLWNKFPFELSGGQQQRVSIARILVSEPEIIFADEPTGALDSETSEEVMQSLAALNHNGSTIVMITHNENFIKYANKVIRISDGKILSITNNKQQHEEGVFINE